MKPRIAHRGPSFLANEKLTVQQKLWFIDCEFDQWYSYTIHGLRNEIHGHTRKDQRYYQRKLCSWISRRDRIKSQYPELFI